MLLLTTHSSANRATINSQASSTELSQKTKGGGLSTANHRGRIKRILLIRPRLHTPSKNNIRSIIQYDCIKTMTPLVSIIMGSTSDLPVMEKAARQLDELAIPFEILALSAHRTPDEVAEFARGAEERGVRVIIAGAGMAAHLCGVIASMTPLPVIGVPIKATLDGMDALLAIVQMPPGIPVATVGINGAQNAALLAAQMLSLGDADLKKRLKAFKEGLKEKVVRANADLKEVKYNFKTN